MIFIFVWIIIENHRFYSTRWLKYFVLLLPVIMLGLSIFFIYGYRISPHNPFVKIFDLFVSNRLSLGSNFLEEYGIKWGRQRQRQRQQQQQRRGQHGVGRCKQQPPPSGPVTSCPRPPQLGGPPLSSSPRLFYSYPFLKQSEPGA